MRPLQTIDQAVDYLTYHPPTEEQAEDYKRINNAFQFLMSDIWKLLPEGPGKTLAIRAIGRAIMECNSCIANNGI